MNMTEGEIRKLHRDAVVALSYVNPSIEYKKGGGVSAHSFFTESEPWMEATMPMMRKGGVDLVVLSHGVPDEQRLPGIAGLDCLIRCFDALIEEIRRRPNLALIRTKRDLDDAMRRGKTGIVLHITNWRFNEDLAILRTFFALGVRSMHPFANNPKLGGYAGGPKRLGLASFGRKVIREMERLGMLVDLAHTNDRTFADALKFADKPLMDSHTNCRAIATNYDRNCTDAQLRAIAKRRGLIGVHFGFVENFEPVVDAQYNKMMRGFYKKLNAMQKKYDKDPYEFLEHRMNGNEWPLALGGSVDDGSKIHRAKMSQLGDHVEHMVNVAGIDHVCIGSDYTSGAMPVGVETAETLINLTREMVRRGFTASEVKQIWGGNLVRLLREVLPSSL